MQGVDATLESRERKDYSIGDVLESDEYMVAPLGHGRTATAAPQVGRRGAGTAPSATTTADPIEFRRRLVTTLRATEPIGMAALRRLNVAFYAIVKGTTLDDRVAYVRHLNPLRLTKPGNILAMLGDTLDSMTSPVFAMDDRVDLIVRPDDVSILNKTFFDSLFFGLGGEGAELDGIVAAALSSLPIEAETLAMLVERSRGKKRSRRKMLEIQQSNHLAHVTADQFKTALATQGYPEAQFIDHKGNIFASEDDGDTLLEILNEDVFNGLLTGRPLAATRKRVRG